MTGVQRSPSPIDESRRRRVPTGLAAGVVAAAVLASVGVVAWRWMDAPAPPRTPDEHVRRALLAPGFSRLPVEARREAIRNLGARFREDNPEIADMAEWDEEVAAALRDLLGDFTDSYARDYVLLDEDEQAEFIEDFLEDVETLTTEVAGVPGMVGRVVGQHMRHGRARASGGGGGVSDRDVRIMEWVALSNASSTGSLQRYARVGRFIQDIVRHQQK